MLIFIVFFRVIKMKILKVGGQDFVGQHFTGGQGLKKKKKILYLNNCLFI
jgi:hypothetical protein